MELDSFENSNWLLDYDISEFPPPAAGFSWPSQSTLNAPPNVSAAVGCSFADSDSLKEVVSRKRLKSESCGASRSKACREKLRRDKLNDRFLELGAILEPGRLRKTDKVAILSDTVRIVHQLQSEAQKLKESNEELQAKIKELKAEKNELRDEKQRLKADKEKLEQQVKAISTRSGFLPHPPPMPSAFAAQGQAAGNKLMPFIGLPGVAMWQFMPPAAVDTSRDHVLRPPVA
ncbi:transcription factor ILR3-like [Durio zibethinus]|uniref:Transcription factor ILR3-like n=1 Tax=Durio zibethinus TaxID=66656 RepID=A0A6P5Z974_DURZI|nr:transcription factor ILR3-like [Durio zibethinus]